MNAASEIAQFDRSLVQCGERGIGISAARTGSSEGRCEARLRAHRANQALLRAVVQVALQPLTFGDDRFGDAVSRCAQFLFGATPLGRGRADSRRTPDCPGLRSGDGQLDGNTEPSARLPVISIRRSSTRGCSVRR
jgi:hypothetical protein